MARNILAPGLGFTPQTPSQGTATLALSAANTWFAMSFIGNGESLSNVDLFISALAGSLATTELTLDIYSTGTTGDPNASVSGPHNCSATPAGAAWNSWAPGYTTTDGTMYWVVVKNTNASPGTNTPTFRYGTTGTGAQRQGSTNTLWGFNKNHTTDGSTWTNEIRAACGILLTYASSYNGTPFSNVAATGTGNSVYAAREVGVYVTLPGPRYNVRGLAFFLTANTGTPSAALRARIYSGSSSTPTLVATSSGGPSIAQVAVGWHYFPFASAQNLAAGTYRFVIGTTGADTSSNRYNSSAYTIKNDANSRALMPFGNSVQTYTTDGTNFTETNTEIIPYEIVLDNGNEFTVSGGGGGVLIGGKLVQ